MQWELTYDLQAKELELGNVNNTTYNHSRYCSKKNRACRHILDVTDAVVKVWVNEIRDFLCGGI